MPKSTMIRPGGMPVFVPTQEQKTFVALMAGMRMTWEELCAVIINPRTQRHIDKHTLQKAFAEELANGKARLRSLVNSKFLEALNGREPWAVQFGLRHIADYRSDETTVTVSEASGVSAENVGIQVTFVRPKLIEHAE